MDVNILLYEEEKIFMGKVTKIFIDNVIPDIKRIFEYMKNTNYTKENPLDCECDVFVWMKDDHMFFKNQNNTYEAVILDNYFWLKNLRGGNYHYLNKDIFNMIIDMDEKNDFGISFGSYEYVKDIPSTLSCIIEEIKV